MPKSKQQHFLSFLVLFGLFLSALGPAAPVSAAAAPRQITVSIPGTIQSKLGCPGDWDPACDKTFLTYDAASDLYKGGFKIPAGAYEYKIAIDKSWDENYGLGAKPGGANIPLKVTDQPGVKFYYDDKTHWVTDNINSVIAVVVGNFQTKLGCAQDFDPACMQAWLQDPEGSGVYSFKTTAIPAGVYMAKVAINESMDETYGVEGARNGPNLNFSVPANGTEVYFGFDAGTHRLTIGTAGAPKGNLSRSMAHWVTRDTILWRLPDAAKASVTLHYDPQANLKLEFGGITGGESLKLTHQEGDPDPAILAKFPYLALYSTFKLDPADVARVPAILKGQIAIDARDAQGKLIDATSLQIPGVLDDLFTYQGPLGISIEAGAPVLRVWAPTAQSVALHLFTDSRPATPGMVVPMKADPASGVWTAAGPKDWLGKYYLYEVNVYVPGIRKIAKNLVTDPYSLSLSTNSARSQIVDLSDAALQPKDWLATQKPPLVQPEDSVIYELHVRDFSAFDESVPAEYRGTFKAFTVLDSHGMKHLKALAQAGLTHIHLLPVFDIASVDENKSNWAQPDIAKLSSMAPDSSEQQALLAPIQGQDGYNWGYDPYHYTTPEGSYATNPDGPARILEFRQMVQALNSIGLRVVMDVVYNHTNASGQNEKSVLDKVVPGYYHRLDENGAVTTSTCCQNTASEHAMMEKLMIDSLVTWARDYKVDGFRFDLMGHHMLSNMKNARAALDALTPDKDGVDGKQIYMYGEGWDFGEVTKNARGINATQLNIAGTGIGVFNDRLRDAVRGGTPFGSTQEQGFATGLYVDPNGITPGSADTQKAKLMITSDWIRIGLAGNLKDYKIVNYQGRTVDGADIVYNGQPAAYTASPAENIVYISAHDNETLFDAIQLKAPASASMADRVRMQNLGNSLVMLAQGVPFFQAGDDMLRSKDMDRNSYNSGDWFNRLDFTYETDNWGTGLPPADNQGNYAIMKPLLANPALKPAKTDILAAVNAFQELLKIRKSSRLFRLSSGAEVKDHLTFLNTGFNQIPGLLAMALTDTGAQRVDHTYQLIVVLFNSSPKPQSLASRLKGLALQLHPVQAASSDPVVRTAQFDPASGTFTIPGRTTAVFVADQAPSDVTVLLAAAPAAATATPEATVTSAPTAAPTSLPGATSVPPTAGPAATQASAPAAPAGPSPLGTAAGIIALLVVLLGGFYVLRRAYIRS